VFGLLCCAAIGAGCGKSEDAKSNDMSLSGTGGLPSLGAGTGGVTATPGASGSGGSSPLMGHAGTGAAGMTAGSGGMIAGSGGMAAGSGGMTAGTGGMAAGSGGMIGGGAPGAPCTGKTGMKGDQSRTWDKEGAQYIIHYPSDLDPNTAVPLVFVAHGFTMSGAVMQSLTGFDAVADANHFVVVYPDGDGGATPWNVGDGTCAPGSIVDAPSADSFGYLDAMRASVEADQCIDAKKIFITGFSMGGYFTHNVSCQRGNSLVRAGGPHSGGTYEGDCPGAPLPIFIMHGDADTFIDYNLCGKGARDMWLQRNKCGTEFETRMVEGGSCDWYKDCDPNGQTVFCSFNGVAHAWAGGATNAVWDFFKMYL
jgi:polyhydroxybutyrate depolymerase